VRGINQVTISGNVKEKMSFASTANQTPACTFQLASDRHSSSGVVTAFVKVNCYGEGLVNACRAKLAKGVYVIVAGELMCRDGQLGDLVEVRAREIIFLPGQEAGHGQG
jgi:single-stranded DNA-binding protein